MFRHSIKFMIDKKEQLFYTVVLNNCFMSNKDQDHYGKNESQY